MDPDSGKKKYIYGPQKHRRAWERLPELKGKSSWESGTVIEVFFCLFCCCCIFSRNCVCQKRYLTFFPPYTGWLRPSKKAEYYSYCSYCDKHLKANRRSLLDHAKSRVHLDSLPNANGRLAPRRQTMHNVPLVDDMPDPLLTNEPIDEDDDDYDDSMAMGDGYMDDDGGPYAVTQMGKYENDDSEVDTKDGILVNDSDDDSDGRGFHPPLPPLVQLSVQQDPYNGHEVSSGDLCDPAPLISPFLIKSRSAQSFAGSHNQQLAFLKKNNMDKYPVSTHILDTMHGVPAIGVPVSTHATPKVHWPLK